MQQYPIIGIDLGGTNVRAGLVGPGGIERMAEQRIDAQGSVEKVLGQIYEVIDRLEAPAIAAIGAGVPGPVDTATGTVYDLINIPAWREVPLKALLEKRYRAPAYVNNDANCFALGERHFGQGRDCASFIGLIIGTGMAGGIILNGKLYEGRNCGAGEFGMIRYLDHFYEYYASGQFFDHAYGIGGKEAAQRARQGEPEALAMWQAFGVHVGRAFETILYAYDPERIILGGSVGKSFALYEKWVWETLRDFAYQHSVTNLQISVSQLEQPGVLGAAGLALNARE